MLRADCCSNSVIDVPGPKYSDSGVQGVCIECCLDSSATVEASSATLNSVSSHSCSSSCSNHKNTTYS